MSYYVHGSNLSYLDYLSAKNFVGDVTAASRNTGRTVALEVSRQTREVIASNEALARENIQVMEASTAEITGTMNQGFNQIAGTLENGFSQVSSTLNDGFDRLSYGIDDISAGISELNATFHWGFGEVIASLGHMNDYLETLVEIAKTPVQTVAFNHFEIARDAYRQGLYRECLEELEKAIVGDHTSSGYKMEWRFHHMKGSIKLGFAKCDLELVDLAVAEASFLLASRYARADYPKDAARAALSAGWAAYCQGKMNEALDYTEQATTLDNELGEALFQAAKVKMAMGDVDAALPMLGKAVVLDRFYALKAAGDGDFQAHDDRLRGFFEALRQEKYRQLVPVVEAALEKVVFWREYDQFAGERNALRRLDDLQGWSLFDLIEVGREPNKIVTELENAAQDIVISLPMEVSKVSTYVDESYLEEETYQENEVYQEEVIIPGGFFRRKSKNIIDKTRTVTKTRMVTRTRKVQKIVEELNVEFFNGLGTKLTNMVFCLIPSGTFQMGEEGKKHEVILTKKFMLGKFSVTNKQWEAVMGNKSSQFKGPNQPVENVSWNDCQEFIEKINKIISRYFRIPSEAEWEYACRAGSETAYCFGDDISQLSKYAWYKKNAFNTLPVGTRKPNVWGLFDMHGNVSEWCQDWYGEYLSARLVTNPEGPSSGLHRVYRGGSWMSKSKGVCSPFRGRGEPSVRNSSIGFRLVLSL